MKHNITIFTIIILILVAGYFIFFNTQPVSQETSLNQDDVDVVMRDMTDVPAEYFSGNSRFSHGACQVDTDCHNIGCSLEMCSSDPDLMTSCEIGGDFPDRTIYKCGCIKDVCGWYFK